MESITTKPPSKKFAKTAIQFASFSLILMGSAYAVSGLETQVTKVSNALLGGTFTAIVAVYYGYNALPLFKEFQMGKLFLLTFMAGVVEFVVIMIQLGKLKDIFG